MVSTKNQTTLLKQMPKQTETKYRKEPLTQSIQKIKQLPSNQNHKQQTASNTIKSENQHSKQQKQTKQHKQTQTKPPTTTKTRNTK